MRGVPSHGDLAVLAVAEIATERNHRPHQERRHERKEWGQPEDEPIGTLGKEVFFEEQLDAVGKRLEESEGTSLVRADPVLHPGDDLALEPHHEHRDDETNDKHDQHLDQHEDDRAERQISEQIVYCQHHRLSIRTSVTALAASMSSPTWTPGWLNAIQAVPR